MPHRSLVVAAAALVLVGSGCRRNRTPAGPGPNAGMDSSAAGTTRSQAAADSIARIERAERARREAAATAERERTAAEAARVRTALTEMIFFEYDSDQLSQESQDRLRAKAEVLRANPGVRLRIEGHADERGSTEYNVVLGQRRAEQVRTYLVGFGVAEAQLSVLSYGEERPLEQGGGEGALARNRRAEFSVVGCTATEDGSEG